MLVGSLLSLVAAIFYMVGNLMEKAAVGKMAEFSVNRAMHMIRTLLGSKLWVFGFVISLVGLGIQVLAFSRTPILVVQAIFGGAIVLLVMCSHLYLRERLHRSEIVGLAIAIPALILITISLGGSSSNVGEKGSTTAVFGWGVVSLGIAVATYLLFRRRFAEVGLLYGVTSGAAYGVASLGSKGASTFVDRHGVLRAIPDIISSPYPYLFLVALSLGLMAFQSGLQRCRIAVVSPVSSVSSSVYVVVVGSLLFGEHLPNDTRILVLRLIGFVGVLIGSFFLARSEQSADVAVDSPHLGLRGAEELAAMEQHPDQS